jgi:hypothetical protein
VIKRILTGLLLAAAFLAGCRAAPANPSPTLTPSPASLSPTPVATRTTVAPSPTPPATAKDTAAAYLAAWKNSDYAGMYALLAQTSRAALSAAVFEKQYRDNLSIMSATTYTATVSSIAETGDSAQAQAHLTYNTRLEGVLDTDVTLPLQRANGRWGVVYSPALIWPELVNGQKLYMVSFVPDRGTIYDRNGVPIVTKAKAYAIGVVPGEIAADDTSVANGLSRLLDMPAADIVVSCRTCRASACRLTPLATTTGAAPPRK